MRHINSLKGKDRINKMKELMGKLTVNESTQSSKVEITKLGSNNKVYGVIRENQKYFLKISDKINDVVLEDFKYIGGLENKNECAYPSYSKALKKLNLKMISLNEVYCDNDNVVNSFKNDNLLKENKEEVVDFEEEEIVEAETPIVEDDSEEEDGEVDCEVLNDEEINENKSTKLSILDALKECDVKKKSLSETKYKLKVDDPTPAPSVEPQGANTQDVGSTNDLPQDDSGFEQPSTGGESGEKEFFDKEPFDAEVEANEDEDPKKFIQQLSGKLGQSIRNYTENNGVDFELEKFAINSVISATNTARMEKEDQSDIIEKIHKSGNQNDEEEEEDDFSDHSDNGDDLSHGVSQDSDGGEASSGFAGAVSEEIGILDKEHKQVFKNHKLGVDENGLDFKHNTLSLGDLERMCDELKLDFVNDEKMSTFGEENLQDKIRKYMNDDMLAEPEVKPEVRPEIAPSEPVKIPRRRKPYIVKPNQNPKPKANE